MNIHQITHDIQERTELLGLRLLDGDKPTDAEIAEILGLDADFDNKIVAYHHVMRNFENLSIGLKVECDALKAKKDKADKQLERMQEALMYSMKLLNKTTAGNDLYGVKIQKNKASVEITDISKVPSEYTSTSEPKVTADKRAIYKDREKLQGCEGIEFVHKEVIKLT